MLLPLVIAMLSGPSGAMRAPLSDTAPPSPVTIILSPVADTSAAMRGASAKPTLRFTGDIGYVSAGGNSSAQTLNLGDRVTIKSGILALTQQFSVVHGRSKGETVTSLWRASIRIDVTVDSGMTLYGSSNYERNVFAGLASRVGNTAGVSARVVTSTTDRLSVEGGVSLTVQRGVSETQDMDFLGGRAATLYVHRIGPRATFTQSVEFLPNFHDGEDLRINSESALLAPISKQVGIKLSFAIRYDGLPQPGYLRTDRLFTSGLQVAL